MRLSVQKGTFDLWMAGQASIKIVYDLLLWSAFRRLRPPEER